MDYLRVFFLTLFLVIMTAWVVVMVPVLSNLSKGASHPVRLADVALPDFGQALRDFAAPKVRLLP